MAEALRNWASAEDEPDKLILPLEHAYTPAELSFGALKGADAGVASVLVKAAAEADCDLHLALVSIEESGSAEHTGYYGRRRWGRDEDDEEFEVAEVFDRALILSEWRRPDGGEAGFDDFPFTEDELCPPDAFDDLAPDEEHFHEATGNEGASFERTYRRAGLVLWPAARRLAVLNQAGLRTTLPYLENLTARWEANGASIQSSLWREADELSGHMLRSWPRSSWRRDDDAEAGRMLDLQVRLGNVKRIDEFLAELSAEGHYAASDNGAIVRAAALLPPARATELMVRIVGRNAPAHLSACGDLLLRSVAAPIGALGDLGRIGAALIDAMPGDPTKREEVDPWTRPKSVKPGFVVDLLTATSRIDAGLAARAIERLLRLAEDIRARRRADARRSRARQAGGEQVLAGGGPAAGGVSRPFAQAHRSAAGGATGLDQGQPAQMRMRRLPCARRLPGCAGSTAVAPEGGPGSKDPCRAKRPERGVRPRPHDRKTRQPAHACRHQERGQLPAARRAAPSGSRACIGARRMSWRRAQQRDRPWNEPEEQGSTCRSCRQGG